MSYFQIYCHSLNYQQNFFSPHSQLSVNAFHKILSFMFSKPITLLKHTHTHTHTQIPLYVLNGNPVLYHIKANRIADPYESLKGNKWAILFMCTHAYRKSYGSQLSYVSVAGFCMHSVDGQYAHLSKPRFGKYH